MENIEEVLENIEEVLENLSNHYGFQEAIKIITGSVIRRGRIGIGERIIDIDTKYIYLSKGSRIPLSDIRNYKIDGISLETLQHNS